MMQVPPVHDPRIPQIGKWLMDIHPRVINLQSLRDVGILNLAEGLGKQPTV